MQVGQESLCIKHETSNAVTVIPGYTEDISVHENHSLKNYLVYTL